MDTCASMTSNQLVGGWVSTHLKNMRTSKWVHLPQIGVKIKKHLKPPPSPETGCCFLKLLEHSFYWCPMSFHVQSNELFYATVGHRYIESKLGKMDVFQVSFVDLKAPLHCQTHQYGFLNDFKIRKRKSKHIIPTPNLWNQCMQIKGGHPPDLHTLIRDS